MLNGSHILYNFRCMTTKGSKTLLACSGGIDSVVMTYLASKIRDRQFAVGHISHNVRTVDESTNDYNLVKSLADKLNLEFRHVPLVHNVTKNMEANLRSLRYNALASMSSDCEAVATAHHADDNLVTRIMQIARGNADAIGIRPIHTNLFGMRVIRPLIDMEKDEIRAIALKSNLRWNNDSTNENDEIVRNDFNRNIVPLIKKHYPRAARKSVQTY